jgi:hypothetical protein
MDLRSLTHEALVAAVSGRLVGSHPLSAAEVQTFSAAPVETGVAHPEHARMEAA